MATRRQTAGMAPSGDSTANTKSTAPRPIRGSPFLPTSLEALLLALYPTTLLLGSLFSVLSDQTRNAPYSAATQSHPPHVAPSYFARKGNIFNLYFVKFGWFWTTIAFGAFIASHPTLGPSFQPVLTPRRAKALARYALVTVWWIAVTQWFFGPPLIDRSFRFTGGQCELVDRAGLSTEETRRKMGEFRIHITHAACKAAGGIWKGGHDISGHVFLLILGSATLWLEVLPIVLRAGGLRVERRIQMQDGTVRNASVEAHGDGPPTKDPKTEDATSFGVKAALTVAGLSWWMLLMTAAFFHTWFEKFTGLLVAFMAIYMVYFLPRGVPQMRAFVGVPGI